MQSSYSEGGIRTGDTGRNYHVQHRRYLGYRALLELVPFRSLPAGAGTWRLIAIRIIGAVLLPCGFIRGRIGKNNQIT